MSALADEVRAAVAAGLDERAPAIVEAALTRVILRLQIGDAGDQLLDADAAAELLGTTASALRRSEERGKSPVVAIRLGRRLKWRRRDLLAYVSGGSAT